MKIEHVRDIARKSRIFRPFCLGNESFQKFEPPALSLLQLGDFLGQPVLVEKHLFFSGSVLVPADVSVKERVKKPVEAGLCLGHFHFLPGKNCVGVLRLALLQLRNPALPLVEPIAKPGFAGLAGKLADQDFLAGVLQRAQSFPLRASVVVVSLLKFGGDRCAALTADEIPAQWKGRFLLLSVRPA